MVNFIKACESWNLDIEASDAHCWNLNGTSPV
jgi:hypothetical protein